MKHLAVIAAMSSGILTGCTKKEAMTEAAELPGPQRATLAANPVRPALPCDLAAVGLHLGDPVFIRAFKDEKRLELFIRDRTSGKFALFRSYDIAGTSGVPGPKLAEGDLQVPEGFYHVPKEAMKPDSQFHLAFNIGFPNEYDLAHRRTGTFIMVHGGHQSIGCLAMTDPVIEEIYTLCDAALDHGQPFFRIHIFPFRMTSERLQAAAGNANAAFWANLKEGYDVFENRGTPPDVSVADGRYRFK